MGKHFNLKVLAIIIFLIITFALLITASVNVISGFINELNHIKIYDDSFDDLYNDIVDDINDFNEDNIEIIENDDINNTDENYPDFSYVPDPQHNLVGYSDKYLAFLDKYFDKYYEADDILYVKPKNIYVYDVGSSKKLLGDCLLFTVYVSDQESFFTENEKISTVKMLDKSIEYINSQAVLHNQQINIIYNKDDLNIDYYYDGIISTDMRDFEWSYEVIDGIINSAKEIIEKYNADNYGFVFHVNKDGKTFSVQCNLYTEMYAPVENAIIYTKDTDSPTNAFVYAHELLHLFGALDLYYPEENDDRFTYANQIFPDDIMIRYFYDEYLNEALIGEITSYMIGWSDYINIENYFYVLSPYEYMYEYEQYLNDSINAVSGTSADNYEYAENYDDLVYDLFTYVQ